jgi:hypothetical protein
MASDYEEYEKECAAIRKINGLHLSGFEICLKNSGLAVNTIARHVSNVDFYINDFLCYYDARDVRHGCYCVDRFLGDWFIRKAPSSCSGIKSNAVSFKKFYAYLLAVNVIDQKDYDALCSVIKAELPAWLNEMKRYDDWIDGLDDVGVDFF